MGHSLGDGLIVTALVAAFLGYYYMKHVERRRRLEIVHQERLAAMEKGIPLPELPLEPPAVSKAPNPHAALLHGIVWSAFGLGTMAALWLFGESANAPAVWPFPLPIAFLGLGLMLYYFLSVDRAK